MSRFDEKKLLEILYQYALDDIAETLFITDAFPENIAAPVKISLLWETFRTSDPAKYQTERKFESYGDYHTLATLLTALIPSYPTVEDIAYPPDWGEVKYRFEGSDYKFFYYGDLENPFDYLLLYDRLLAANDKRLSKEIGRSPSNSLWGVLYVQDTIISLIPRYKPKERIRPGDFGPATEQFWAAARVAYSAINTVLVEQPGKEFKEFLEAYTLPIQKQPINFSKIPDLVMQGRATPYIFLSANNKLYLANTRRINSVLFTSTHDLLEKHNVEFELSELNIAVYKFLNSRFKGVAGPFLVDVAQTDSLSYAAAFVAGDQLILVHVAQPISGTHFKVDEIYKKAEADIKSLSKNSYRLFEVLSSNIIEWRTNENRQLSASMLIVLPYFPVAFTSFSLPRMENISLILGDEFLSIFDDLEDMQEYADYLEYKNRLANVFMSYVREIDKYAAFKYASGTLVKGANIPDMIYLESGMGGDYRFDKLKRFWRLHPRTGWGGPDPTTWRVDDQKTHVRIYRRKDRFQNILYTRLNKVDFFALSPLDLIRNDEEVMLTADLLLQISVDHLLRAIKTLGVRALVPFAKLKLVVYPNELLVREDFAHLRHLDPTGELWRLDAGRTGPNELTVRLVLDKDKFLEFTNNHADNSPEIDFMLAMLRVLESYHPETIKKLIEYVQAQRGAPKRFSTDMLSKHASFPPYAPDHRPETGDFKLIDNEVAKIAKAESIKQGLFSKKDAIKNLNQLRDLLKQKIEEEVAKYDLVMSLPLLLGSLDALTSNYDLKRQELKLSLDRDVDYDRAEHEKEAHGDYTHYGKCYRYLIEKFVSLSPKGRTALREKEFRRLVALTERLLSIYEASDIITYFLVTHQPRLRVNSDYSVKIVNHYQTEKESKQLAQEEAAFRLKAYRGKVAEKRDHEATIELINQAFLEDYGFEFKNMCALLQLLATWTEYVNTAEDISYSADEPMIIKAAQSALLVPITEEEIKAILDFVTLKQDKVLMLIDDPTPTEDVPVWEQKKRPMRYTLRPLIKVEATYYWGPYACHWSIGVWDWLLTGGGEPYNLNKDTALSKAIQSIRTEKENAIVDETYNLARTRSLKTEKNVYLHKRDSTGDHPNVGDFDTLSFVEDVGVLLNIECKHVVPAQTPRDAYTQTQHYFDQKSGRKYLVKVEKRHDYLEKNTQKVFASMGWAMPKDGVKVVSIMVVNQLYSWMRFPLKSTHVIFMDLPRLKDYLDNL